MTPLRRGGSRAVRETALTSALRRGRVSRAIFASWLDGIVSTYRKTKFFCIIGDPISHSLSPAMHNAAFRAKRINALYLAVPVKNLKKDIPLIIEAGFSGFNITMPLKEKVLPYAHFLSGEVKQIGAANTALVKNGKLFLYNTDCLAVEKLIAGKISAKGKKALVLGAGGAAKAICYALKKLGAEIFISNRTFSKAKIAAKRFGGKAIDYAELNSSPQDYSFDIIANATSLGMGNGKNLLPCNKKLIGKARLVYESVYYPRETRFLKEAKKMNLKTIEGIDMLLEQAYEAFRLFTTTLGSQTPLALAGGGANPLANPGRPPKATNSWHALGFSPGLLTGKKAPERAMRKAVLSALRKRK